MGKVLSARTGLINRLYQLARRMGSVLFVDPKLTNPGAEIFMRQMGFSAARSYVGS